MLTDPGSGWRVLGHDGGPTRCKERIELEIPSTCVLLKDWQKTIRNKGLLPDPGAFVFGRVSCCRLTVGCEGFQPAPKIQTQGWIFSASAGVLDPRAPGSAATRPRVFRLGHEQTERPC